MREREREGGKCRGGKTTNLSPVTWTTHLSVNILKNKKITDLLNCLLIKPTEKIIVTRETGKHFRFNSLLFLYQTVCT